MHPRGIVARVEHQRAHRDFVRAVEPETILVDLIDARQLVKREMTASDYYGESPTVVTTSTVSDEKLDLIPWECERDIVHSFAPDFHIPTDYSIYGGHDRTERVENLEEMMRGSLWMQEQLSDADTTVIPQIKGFTRQERRVCYRDISRSFDDYALFYAAQYFGGESGNRINDLVADLTDIRAETDANLLVVGLLAPDYVTRLPDNVVAVAGQYRWRTRVKPRKHDGAEMRSEYADLRESVKDALSG